MIRLLVALALILTACGPHVDAPTSKRAPGPELEDLDADDEVDTDGVTELDVPAQAVTCSTGDAADCCRDECPGLCVGPTTTQASTCACPMGDEACQQDVACADLGCSLACLIDLPTGAVACGCGSDNDCALGETCSPVDGTTGGYGVCR